MKDRRVCAEYLFDEIGSIDERIIAESIAYSPAPARKRFLALKIVLAATLSTALSFAMILLLFVNLSKSFRFAATPSSDPLTEVLMDSRSIEGYEVFVSAEQIDLFDGEAKLIWQYPDDSSYCVINLSTIQKRDIVSKIGYGTEVSDDEPSYCHVWIANGDGTTISPYLKTSDGNVGYGALLSYSAEIVPSYSLADLIGQIIDDNESNM